MPRNTRTTSSRKSPSTDRSSQKEGTKMHASRSNESDRETRMGSSMNANGGSRKSGSRTSRTH